jgi:hypothetical protein
MADEPVEILKTLGIVGRAVRYLADQALQVAAALPPLEGEQVRRSVMKLMNSSERLDVLSTTTGPGLEGLRSSLGTTIDNLTAAMEILRVVGHKKLGEDDFVN